MFRSWSGDMDRSVNRFGLSEVSKPDAGISQVDIVFVHGINGHPSGTWTSEKEKTFWPAQLLPPFVEEAKARVLVYGYDADTVSSTEEIAHSDTPFDRHAPPKSLTPLGQDRIHNHAEHLVATLWANRSRRHATDHPIVFVAHSLGGIVVKRALIHSSGKKGKHTGHLRSIALSTYGILFLGTPHSGCETTEWPSWSKDVSSITRKDVSQARLLEALKPNSETLQNIDRQFVELANESKYHIFFFHETNSTKMDDGWRYLVDERSAAPVIQNVERAGIQQDHSHMCTFDNADTPGFALVTEAIERYAAEAPQTISNRWVMDSREQQLRLHGGMTSGPMQYPTSNPAVQTSDTLATSDHAATQQKQRHFLVPWDRVKVFVGREAQLEKIAKCFTGSSTQQPRVLVVHALGGQGKSQLVLEYCWRRRKDYQGVFWVNASSRSLALQSYGRVAGELSSQPQAIVDDGEQIIETVKTLLEKWEESWLIIFDNYDKPDDFGDVRQFLPRGEHGHVIITSRRRDLDRIGVTMELGALSPDEGVNLLLRGRQEIDENLKTAKEIIRRLGGLALAIDQAGAYIAHRRIPPHRLQGFLETYEAQRKEILSYTPGSLWEYGSMQSHVEEDHTKAINAFTTWEISLKELLRDNPQQQKDAIIRLLTLSAYFNPARIEELLFRNYWAAFHDKDVPSSKRTRWRHVLKSPKKKSQQSNVDKAHAPWLRPIATKIDLGKKTSSHHNTTDHWDTEQFWDTLTKIHNLSLVQHIEKDAQGASFSLHPLVRDWLQHRGQLVDHQQYLIEGFEILRNTAKIYSKDLTSWTRLSLDQKAALVSHIDACMLIDEHLAEPHKHLGNEETSYDTADDLAFACYKHGRYDPAEKLLHRITKNENAHILYFTYFCKVLIAQGKYEQVVELSYRCQQYRENTLDEGHPDRLAFESCLSEALGRLGRYDDAESLQRVTLRLRQEVLGELHWDTLESMSDLAFSLYRQNRFEDSEALARETLQLCKSTLPEDDGITLNVMYTLAVALERQSQLNEAETLLRKVVCKSQISRGRKHPGTLTSMHNLALIIESTKKDEAEELYRYVVQTRKEVVRKGHPDTLYSMRCLANLLQKDGRDEEAKKIMQERAEAAEGIAD